MSRERKTFSDNLKTLMNNNGVNRKKLSADLGISYNTIASWVIGSKFPRIDKIEKLAAYFGVPKAALIEEADDEITITESIIKAAIGKLASEDTTYDQASILKCKLEALEIALRINQQYTKEA